MNALPAQDALFDEPGWTAVRVPSPFTQRYRLQGRHMFCETLCAVRGHRDAAVALVRGPWRWWHHGRVIRYAEHADGTSEQVLAPIWWYIARMGIHAYQPQPLDAGGVRVSLAMSGHIAGLQTVDVIDAEPGRLTIRVRLHGATNHFPGAPPWLMLSIHLRVESGTALFPFPRGSGWCGFQDALDG